MAQRTFPSIIELLPRPEYFKERTLLRTEGRDYSANDYRDMFSLFGCEECLSNYNDLTWANISFPMVNMTCAYGTQLFTPKYYEYKPDAELRGVDEEGDGVVNMGSLEYCRKWEKISPRHRVNYITVPKAKHRELVSNERLFKDILDNL